MGRVKVELIAPMTTTVEVTMPDELLNDPTRMAEWMMKASKEARERKLPAGVWHASRDDRRVHKIWVETRESA